MDSDGIEPVRLSRRMIGASRRAALVSGRIRRTRPTLTDMGYIGAGISIHAPVRRPKGQSEQALHADARTKNALIQTSALSVSAPPPNSRNAGTHPRASPSTPSRIGEITRAALALNRTWKRPSPRRAHSPRNTPGQRLHVLLDQPLQIPLLQRERRDLHCTPVAQREQAQKRPLHSLTPDDQPGKDAEHWHTTVFQIWKRQRT